MARWRLPTGEGIPERLCRFVLADWPEAECGHQALQLWERACFAWLAEDSDRQPRPGAGEDFNRAYLAGGSRRRLPFGEDGSALDVLREGMRIHPAIPPCPVQWGRPGDTGMQGPSCGGCRNR